MKGTDHEIVFSSELISEAVSWRRDLHRHPELAYKETRTAEFVASKLRQFGLTVHSGLAGTGVVGTLTRGTSRRTIAIRADMDGLPIQEQSALPYASSTPGIMHACGHDGHVAMALAAAGVCAREPNLDGTVHFIFQPAEENEGGAERMINEGLFRKFPCDLIYALHNWPALPLGACVVREGAMMAAYGRFEILVSGAGCHGAMPHQGADCILAGSQLVSALHSIVSRNIDPVQGAVISATQVYAGQTWNVIPNEFIVRGTTRWFDAYVGDQIERRLTELAQSIAVAFGCAASVRYERRFPATINHPVATDLVRSVVSAPPISLALVEPAPSMTSEDFAFMLNEVPGCYLWLGSAGQEGHQALHSSSYDFNDDLLPTGVALWVSLVRKILGTG